LAIKIQHFGLILTNSPLGHSGRARRLRQAASWHAGGRHT